MTEMIFEAPGPGTWHLMDLHFPRPLTRYNEQLPHGWTTDRARQGLANYGILTDFEVETVNRFAYLSRQPVDGTPHTDSEPVSLDDLPNEPESDFERRVQNAKETFESRRWRADLERWDNEWKPTIRENNRSLQDVSPADLDDEELIDHLEACRDALIEHSSIVFRIAPCGLIPQSDFMALVREHTDVAPADVIPLFAGSSPVPRGRLTNSRPSCRRLRRRMMPESWFFRRNRPTPS